MICHSHRNLIECFPQTGVVENNYKEHLYWSQTNRKELHMWYCARAYVYLGSGCLFFAYCTPCYVIGRLRLTPWVVRGLCQVLGMGPTTSRRLYVKPGSFTCV